MTDWRPARCLLALRAEVNDRWPGRPTAADGMIGDARHQAERSDHNPNRAGVVTAWDITTAPWSDSLAETLRKMGAAGDKRVKYVIWRRRITSAEHGWQWAAYTGADPHTGHIHLSVSADPNQYDRSDPWLRPIPPVPFQPPEEWHVSPDDETKIRAIVQSELRKLYGDVPDSDPTHISLTDLAVRLDKIAKKVGA